MAQPKANIMSPPQQNNGATSNSGTAKMDVDSKDSAQPKSNANSSDAEAKDMFDFLPYHTVRLTTWIQTPSGPQETGVSTGFFFEDSGHTYIITNKHALTHAPTPDERLNWNSHASFVTWRSHCSNGKGWVRPGWYFEFRVPIEQSKIIWHPAVHHPRVVDLCGIDCFGATISPAACREDCKNEEPPSLEAKNVFFKAFTENDICEPLKDELCAIEELTMIGYPAKLWDEVNNLPIGRYGKTAIAPYVDFNGRQEGLVDMACFPGSSGSPLCIATTFRRTRNFGLKVGGFFKLVGITHQAYHCTEKGEIVAVPVPTDPNPRVFQINSKHYLHLTRYVKASEIRVMLQSAKASSATSISRSQS